MRKAIRYAAIASIVALTLTGCSMEKSATGGNADGVKPLVMTAGGGTTFTRNFNIFAPTTISQTPGSSFIYEPLLATDRSKAGTFKPWLATSYEWSDGGKTLTFKLRNGVKWSDGKPFTSADVKYTLDLYSSGSIPASAPFKSVDAPDANTVVVHYSEPSYGDLGNFSSKRLIVPQHIWASQDVRTWTNPTPVGTGPMSVETFGPQAVMFKIRSDYWGGQSKGVKEVQIVTSANHAATQSSLNQNTLDWSTMGWPNVQKEFVGKDPNHHKFNFYPTGGADGITFNTTVAPYNDVHVRQALRDSIDPAQVAKIVGVGFAAPNVLGLDPNVYSSVLKPEYSKPLTPDVTKAKAELAAGGWAVKDGNLVKDGNSYPLTYDVYQPYAEWVTSGQVIASQWKTGLGLNVTVHPVGDQPFTQADTTGKFGMDSGSPTNAGSTYSAFAGYLKANYAPIGQVASANTGRWQNAKFEDLMQQYISLPPGETDKLQAISEQIQDVIANDAPFIPVATSGWKAELNTTHWTNWPNVGSSYVPNGTLVPDATQTILNLTPSK